MTIVLGGDQLAGRLARTFPYAIVSADREALIVKSESLYEIAEFLKNTPALDFDYLTDLAAVDYVDYFEVVYQLISLKHNHSLVLKTRCHDRDNPTVPSVVSLWRSADFLEREIYDLLGIVFDGHPNLKRLLLWDGFVGHPLRRDYL
jgi:NADH-quinone oxidoreductase subunit C